MLIYPKRRISKLCDGLTLIEFRCKCKYESCRATLIDDFLIDAYYLFRKAVQMPLKINSGYRCAMHNIDVGGKPLSRHQSGEAIDIDIEELLKIYSKQELRLIAYESGFTFVKMYIAKNYKFMHCDIRKGKDELDG